MSKLLAETVAPHIPYLRRFARALTGSQQQGDGYVVVLLETLVADPRNFRHDLPPRSALYQGFIKVWNAMPFNDKPESVENRASAAADRRIETLTPRPRQAFLLAALEEFSLPDIAAILDASAEEVTSLIDVAGREIALQIAAKVMIIEDEPLIALDIETLVTDIGHTVVGIARTRQEAVAMAVRSPPELVLADIQLADGSSGIDAVNDILRKINVPVIFITAFPERLLTGQRPEPTFLITKPFKAEMVKAVISQAMFFDIQATAKRGTAA
jgi:DNA-directed RNA polymerase specialized sigma24 family protein